LTDAARDAISSALAAALPRGVPGRPVPAANWHLTLRFLGETPAEAESRLVGEMEESALGEAFEISFGSLGAFPRSERAAVLWMGISTGTSELAALAQTVEQTVRRAGFPAEGRPFSAHLTLSRFRPAENVAPLVARSTGEAIAMPVREVVLYRSHLGGGPVRYEAAARFGLR